jgi:hypothetical protein
MSEFVAVGNPCISGALRVADFRTSVRPETTGVPPVTSSCDPLAQTQEIFYGPSITAQLRETLLEAAGVFCRGVGYLALAGIGAGAGTAAGLGTAFVLITEISKLLK